MADKYRFETFPRDKAKQFIYDKNMEGKTMSEKYRINEHEDCGYIILSDKHRIVVHPRGDSWGGDENEAKRICHLLNEDDNRKSMQKINKEFKNNVLIFLAYGCYEDNIPKGVDKMDFIFEIMKLIESLESEE